MKIPSNRLSLCERVGRESVSFWNLLPGMRNHADASCVRLRVENPRGANSQIEVVSQIIDWVHIRGRKGAWWLEEYAKLILVLVSCVTN